MVPISVGRTPSAPTVRGFTSHAARTAAGEICGAEGACLPAQPVEGWRRSAPVAGLMPFVTRPKAEVAPPRADAPAVRRFTSHAARTAAGEICGAEGAYLPAQPVEGWRRSAPAAELVPIVMRPKAEVAPPRANAPAGLQGKRRLDHECPCPEGARRAAWMGSSELPVGRDAVVACHRKRRRMPREFTDPKERETFLAGEQIAALVPLLPGLVVQEMLGGERGLRQVPGDEARGAQLARILRERAGSEGDRIADVRRALGLIRAYAQEVLMTPPGGEDDACFPMSSGLAHEVIHWEGERAIAEAAGSQGGTSVGARLADTLIFMGGTERGLRWPIDVSRIALKSAAAAQAPSARRKAGTLPVAAKCQLEHFAAGNVPECVPEPARPVVAFYARSLLSAGLDQSVRLGEGVRVRLWPDELEPYFVMRGHAHLGKDGRPIDIYAPAEGLLGEYLWYPEHLEQVLRLGQVFPGWERPRGAGKSILRATALKRTLAEADDVRGVLKELLQLPPFAASAEQVAAWNIQGHTLHATPPEWARQIGRRPRWAGTPLRDAAGRLRRAGRGRARPLAARRGREARRRGVGRCDGGARRDGARGGGVCAARREPEPARPHGRVLRRGGRRQQPLQRARGAAGRATAADPHAARAAGGARLGVAAEGAGARRAARVGPAVREPRR